MMNDGFVTIASASPAIKVADPAHNGQVSYDAIRLCAGKGANIVVLPECTMTSYISNDFLYQDTLLQEAEDALANLVARCARMDVVFIVGIPLRINCTLYNCAVVCHKGHILGIVPKMHIPTYGVDFEGRWFEKGPADVTMISIAGQDNIPFGSRQVFRNRLMPELCIGVEICEDIWSPDPPSIHLALAGATVLCNCSASNASIEKAIYRRGLISGQGARLLASYTYCSSGNGDSTEDVLVGGHDLVTENGHILAEAKPFESGLAIAEVDVEGLCTARREMSSFVVAASPQAAGYHETLFDMKIHERPLMRDVSAVPFVPPAQECEERCDLVTKMQEHGLLIRMEHAGAKSVSMALSDAADDLLTLMLCAKAFDMKGLPREDIHVACAKPSAEGLPDHVMRLAAHLGCSVHEYAAGRQDLASHARTLAHEKDGIVVGAYDMTRLAIGAAVFPSDMGLDYAINSCVARTLVPLLIRYLASSFGDAEVAKLADGVVMPSELPLDKDEDATRGMHVRDDGPSSIPVDVVDFYLNCLLGSKSSPAKTLRLAKKAFEGTYNAPQLLDWLKAFYERFFATQYDRRNLPDGPEVGSVNISPRGGFMMPARDAGTIWLEQVSHLNA